MRRLSFAAALGIGLATAAVSPAAAQPALDPIAVETARLDGHEPVEGERSPLILRLQVLLDRADVSPGVIDGYLGENVSKALEAYARREGLAADAPLAPRVVEALIAGDGEPVLSTYAITEEDVAGPFVDEIPDDYAELAEMEHLAYRGPQEMLAERFHMDQDLLAAMNPDADFSRAGTEILVAQPGAPMQEASIARIEVSRSDGALRALDSDGNLVLFHPATVGSAQTPSPSGTHEVTAVATDPVYYYRPDVNFQQGDHDEPLEIPPGPNNPVGSVWIDLSEPTYGIHGTPTPAEIDKVYSHGCVRLTNWDAEELADLVETGTTVAFVE
ncbi:L,D-transpeptidase family protein [Salinarimonas rosea]|uniref:L,D-transpeptidase family protein n=1 Tax=Salinarimonas rosea TaxID=552063 RepID=UPI000412462E|nr:L,D-transpeptidase [Salinarimonas rosea]